VVLPEKTSVELYEWMRLQGQKEQAIHLPQSTKQCP